MIMINKVNGIRKMIPQAPAYFAIAIFNFLSHSGSMHLETPITIGIFISLA